MAVHLRLFMQLYGLPVFDLIDLAAGADADMIATHDAGTGIFEIYDISFDRVRLQLRTVDERGQQLVEDR